MKLKNAARKKSANATKSQPRLPHEHDESSDSQGDGDVHKVIKQAHDDIVSGKQDTDLHGVPGLDKPTP